MTHRNQKIWGRHGRHLDPQLKQLLGSHVLEIKFRRADLTALEGYTKSILLGIQAVNARTRSGRLQVFSSCQGLIREAGLYRYPTPEERRLLNTENPLDQDNHSASALRYLVCAGRGTFRSKLREMSRHLWTRRAVPQ